MQIDGEDYDKHYRCQEDRHGYSQESHCLAEFIKPTARFDSRDYAAEDTGDGTFTVTIPADVTIDLFPGGFYELYIVADSDSLARITERRIDLEVVLA